LIAENISTKVYVSLMSQFYPCNNAPNEINRKISNSEYDEVLEKAEELGFKNVYMQAHPSDSTEQLVPDFSKKNPFMWEEI
jgi:putative pyruvate formate lyase activating enzyme